MRIVRVFSALALAVPADWTLSAHHAFRICGRAWAIWALFWLAMSVFSKRNRRRETPLQRLEHIIPAVIGFMLLFNDGLRWPLLARVIFPDVPVLMLFCVIITAFGLLFSVWARLALGSNWSGSVTIKADHQLIRRGPYRSIRHPIYTGMLTALLATAVTQQQLSGLLGFFIILFALYRKALREESFLSQEFGDAFTDHRQHTGMFLPRFS